MWTGSAVGAPELLRNAVWQERADQTKKQAATPGCTICPFRYNLGMRAEARPAVKPLYWVGSSKKDLLALPEEVVDVFGYALYMAQIGKKHEQAKPLTGFRSAGVLEVVEDRLGDTYRAVCTVRFVCGVFVLHVFQKKAKRGIATPEADLDLIRERLKAAEQAAKELGS
jgi:phage-related protein